MSVGGSASLGNLIGYMGACSRSSLVLSCSVWFLFVVLLCELSLSLVLLFDPNLIDTAVCPEGEIELDLRKEAGRGEQDKGEGE
eukprot:762164-Hanusia_phi.AAC.1